MQNRIEPPVLLSRLLIFVFAATVVVLFVLAMTIEKMFPLERPEVFFITTRPESAMQITELRPDDSSLEKYKNAFVMEYVRARNNVLSNVAFMRKKWEPNGIIETWSRPDVYNNFKKTGMFNAMTRDYSEFEFECPTEIRAVHPVTNNVYNVTLSYYCKHNGGQTAKKNYTIRIGLAFEENGRTRWRERLDNPLGIKVSEYVVVNGDGDPLDTGYTD